ncbi:DUF2884 family protein [Vibrio cincinnatiensis]|uniref:DUF2884 family protein n=1 Tax=Vibrio cincinnatiensis TaxID=675 RepID=UPI001EE133E6|nr:DUF2884 family protein [Vibrio cincinnatiensis]
MNNSWLIFGLLFSPTLWAFQCPVDVQNELRINSSQIEIHTSADKQAILDEKNQLSIAGKTLTLTADQQAALASYREYIQALLPELQQLASDKLAVVDELLDDVALSLNTPQAFDNVKQTIHSLVGDIEARYHQNDEWVFPAHSFSSMHQEWQKEFEQAKAFVSQEFFTGAFTALSQGMQHEGGINLTELGNRMAELKAQLEQRLKSYSQDAEQEARALCRSFDEIKQQEQILHQKIPQLQDFPVLLK